MRWQANHFDTLLIEDWGDEYTVFQPDSGKTHLFNRMSVEMLSYLNLHSATASEIGNHLREQFETEAEFDENFEDNIEKILYHFDALGLITKEN